MDAIEISRHDAALLRRVLEGDEEAFDTLYHRHQPPVYRYALRMTGSETVAEDVVQEVFMALIRGARGFDPSVGAVSSYLYGIARNMLLRYWRTVMPSDEIDEHAPAPDVDPLEGLTRAETVGQLRQALLALPLHYREAVVLCELEEMPYADAAETLGVAVGTVRSRLSRARAMLLERLSRNGLSRNKVQA